MAKMTVQDAIDRLTDDAEKIWLEGQPTSTKVSNVLSAVFLVLWIASAFYSFLLFIVLASAGGFYLVPAFYNAYYATPKKETDRLKLIIRMKRLQAAAGNEINVGYYPDVSGEYDLGKIQTAVALQEKKFAAKLEEIYGGESQAYGGASPSFWSIEKDVLRQWAAHPNGAAPTQSETESA